VNNGALFVHDWKDRIKYCTPRNASLRTWRTKDTFVA
jgi:hypothetical protein